MIGISVSGLHNYYYMYSYISVLHRTIKGYGPICLVHTNPFDVIVGVYMWLECFMWYKTTPPPYALVIF